MQYAEDVGLQMSNFSQVQAPVSNESQNKLVYLKYETET